MSKGRYHSVECKQVDWARLSKQAADQKIVFAVDVAKEAFVGLFKVKHGEALLRVKWSHPKQTPNVLLGLEQMRAQGAVVEAVMESSGTYGDVLRWQLRQRSMATYQASAKRVHDAAEVYDGVPSLHDAKACDLIAELHEQGRTRRWKEPDAKRRGFNAQLRGLSEYKGRQQRLRSRLEAHLSRHWPEVLELLALDSASLAKLIAEYGAPQQVYAHEEQARALLVRTGGRFLSEEKIEAVLRSAESTLGVPCVEAEQTHLSQLAKELIETNERLHTVERAIAAGVEDKDELINALAPKLGLITTVVLIALLGRPSDYPNAHSYCKALGLNLKERSSGKHKGRLKITKRGPALARFYLYFAALRLIHKEPLVARWFKAKTCRPGAVKGKQVVELMRRIAKGIWHHARGSAFEVDELFGPIEAIET